MALDNTTTPTDSTKTPDTYLPYFRNPILVEHAAPILAEVFEQRVYAILEQTQHTLPFVGLKYFKQRILPQYLEEAGGRLIAELVLDQLIKDGEIIVDKIKTGYSDFETSTVRKA